MSVIILYFSLIILICVLAGKLTRKFGMPSLLVFMMLGMLFAPFSPYKEHYLLDFSSDFCSFALLIIIFYGGFCTRAPNDKKVILEASLFSSFGTFLTAAFIFLFCCYCLKFPLKEAFLAGAVLSSTDAAAVFSILRSKNLNLKYNAAQLLEIESGSNDPFSYMLTLFGAGLIIGTFNFSSITMLFPQVLYGALIGFLTGKFASYMFQKTDLIVDKNDALFVLACALFAYAFSDITGGNGYLSVYLTGFILGGAKVKNKIALIHFFDGITALLQIMIFFLLGFLSSLSRLKAVFIPASLIALFLCFVARPVVSFFILSLFKSPVNRTLFVSMAGLRGASSIVFGILAYSLCFDYLKSDLFHIVFFVSLFSIAFQGMFLPLAARVLDMTDKYYNVLKTFNDYQDESAISLSKVYAGKNHPWIKSKIKELPLDKNSMVLLIRRGGCKVIPKEETIIHQGDLILIGKTVSKSGVSDIKLYETEIDKNHEWKNKKIKDITLQKGFLIVLVKRSGSTFVPNGHTRLSLNDTIVFYKI